jgi:hypothetical protein
MRKKWSRLSLKKICTKRNTYYHTTEYEDISCMTILA